MKCQAAISKRYKVMKEEYVERIIDLLHKCNDIGLLDLILKLLERCGQG